MNTINNAGIEETIDAKENTSISKSEIFGFDKVHEECAVFGVYDSSEGEAAGITYNALLSMQHRGQEGAGIAVISENTILCHKETGLVNDVFTDSSLSKLCCGNMAVGHTLYTSAGSSAKKNVQPFITEYLTGRIAVAHNGNITNANELRKRLESFGLNFSADSGGEVISSLIAYYSMKTGSSLWGVIMASKEFKGAFSLIIITSDNKLIAVRDAEGFRPLCIGRNESGVAVASESCALDSCGYEFVRDVRPGEVIVIENGEITYEKLELHEKTENCGICIFEYVYFARPDSCIDNLSVYEARYNMGRILAQENPIEADAVCGVPDSGLEAAIGYAAESGLPLVPGFIKNRYIGRSFIYPTQSQRENAVRLKLNPLRTNIEGKRIVLIDDSIVRGTTSRKIIAALKSAGAAEVHMCISSPPFKFSCSFGTDIDSEQSLIANRMSIDEITQAIGADSLGYISIEGLEKACDSCSLGFCTRCFIGR